tara:strand:- start:8129 stop:9295 length:1167 start_codon:yes stop_codon:yes gene_type:complete
LSEFIYLDNAATTPMSALAIAAMNPYLYEEYGNPSSLYSLGQSARRGLDQARNRCAAVLGSRPSEIVFTSGGTESDNAATMGVAFAQKKIGMHIVTTAIEHHALLHATKLLELLGYEVTYIKPEANGLISPDSVLSAIREDTVLVSVMLANNEIGTIQPIKKISDVIRQKADELQHSIYFHTDAVQAPGALSIKVDDLGVDLMSLSAHKFHGPKGVGLLYIRQGTPFVPTQAGGAQERERRAGTENVAGIVAMSVALEEAEYRRVENSKKCVALRDKLFASLCERIEGVHINGTLEHRLPNNVNISFEGIESEPLLMALDLEGIYASSGSACSAGSLEPSHVLRAMKITDERSRASLRLSLSPNTTEEEIDKVVGVLSDQVKRIRKLM